MNVISLQDKLFHSHINQVNPLQSFVEKSICFLISEKDEEGFEPSLFSEDFAPEEDE